MKLRALVALAFAGALAAAFAAGRATADVTGPPPAMTFHGVLEEPDLPDETTRPVELILWNDPVSTAAEARLCDVTVAEAPVRRGHFEVELPPQCVVALRDESAAWIEVRVSGFSFGRARAGTVPSAVRADVASEVQWTGVKGVEATTPWPGTIEADRVLNAPTEALEARLAALEQRLSTDGRFSLSGLVCGATADTTGNLSGYAGLKEACEKACDSDTAHGCSLEEMARTFSLDGVERSGWLVSGVATSDTNDCLGFTNGDVSSYGIAWHATLPRRMVCNSIQPVLCCD